MKECLSNRTNNKARSNQKAIEDLKASIDPLQVEPHAGAKGMSSAEIEKNGKSRQGK